MRFARCVSVVCLCVLLASTGCSMFRSKATVDPQQQLAATTQEYQKAKQVIAQQESEISRLSSEVSQLRSQQAARSSQHDEEMARLKSEVTKTKASQPKPSVTTDKPKPSGKTDIAAVQKALAKAGYDPGPVDGKMGKKTKSALIAFQKAHGLQPDGIAGPRTMAKLGVR
ncbi:MAG: hypothetical protein FJ272_09185 [Planctomycetes bacterium]|nr:hypothetical protein [Planctomycetota bacterium]